MRFKVHAFRPSTSGGGSVGAESAVVVLVVEAVDTADLRRQLVGQGYRILSAAPMSLTSGLVGSGSRAGFQLLLFSQELKALLRAGLPLLEAVDMLAKRERSAAAKAGLEDVSRRLTEGRTLSAAMESQPAMFPTLYVATVRASERTGDIQQALDRYIAYRLQRDIVTKKIVSAAIYPILLMTVGTLVILFLLGFVVPRFSRVYGDMGERLPVLAKMLLAWGGFVDQHLGLVVAALAGLVGGAVYLLASQRFRGWLLGQSWRIPALGERLKVIHLARFYRALSMLTYGGIPFVQALEMVGGVLPTVFAGNVGRAIRSIGEGRNVSQVFEAEQLATTIAARMLAVGERSGQLAQMLEQAATFHEEESARWVDLFTRLFEPLLMAAIGLVIGVIVVLMYMPIFELAGAID